MGRNGQPWRLLEALVNGAPQIANKKKEGKAWKGGSSQQIGEAAVGSVRGRG